ncbi:MAG: 50S ribosomal protein L29 [Candidatus Pacearchaeota archaeon]
MKKFKEMSKLTKSEIDSKIEEVKLELIKARITASKGGKTKINELKKTMARLLMLKQNQENNKS